MLRNVLLAVALALLAIVFLIALGNPGLWPPTFVLALIVSAILFENRRYRHHMTEGGAGMTPTNERFLDPETGRPTRVWIGANGERHYVEESQ
jgi:hypothetical protein